MKLRPFARAFADTIYRVDYFVVCAVEADFIPTLRKLVKAYTDLPPKRQRDLIEQARMPRMERCNGRCIRLSNPGVEAIVIWLRPGVDVSVLVHEAWHAAYWVFEGRGVLWGDGMDEPMAYYLQYLVRQALHLSPR